MYKDRPTRSQRNTPAHITVRKRRLRRKDRARFCSVGREQSDVQRRTFFGTGQSAPPSSLVPRSRVPSTFNEESTPSGVHQSVRVERDAIARRLHVPQSGRPRFCSPQGCARFARNAIPFVGQRHSRIKKKKARRSGPARSRCRLPTARRCYAKSGSGTTAMTAGIKFAVIDSVKGK